MSAAHRWGLAAAAAALAWGATAGALARGAAPAAPKPRARELGIPIGGTPGALDAITDVAGVEVGHVTLVRGSGRLVRGTGPVRTGVTVIHPRGRADPEPVFGAWFALNGNGEMTGTTWLEESGRLEGPVAITNTHSVGVVRDAILQWQVGRPGSQPWGLPVVAETWDGALNDIDGFHVTPAHVARALDSAHGGPVPEGNVGGGTGMICHQFKGGIGTASRVLPAAQGGYTVGVLVQCNYGARRDLRVAGAPVGEEIPDLLPCAASTAFAPPAWLGARPCGAAPAGGAGEGEEEQAAAAAGRDLGSIIVVVATDAPLIPTQLKRIATRVALGIGRTGGYGGNSSGDIFVAFSTAARGVAADTGAATVRMLSNERITPLFRATVQATEAAIVNALLAAETMEGADGMRVSALPHDRLLAALRKYNRLPAP